MRGLKMSSFGINIDESNILPIIEVHGEVDLHTCPHLHQSLTQLLDKGTKTFILDLDHVSYIDSTGLGVIAHAAKSLQQLNAHIKLVCTQPQILKIFELSGLAKKNIVIYSVATEAMTSV